MVFCDHCRLQVKGMRSYDASLFCEICGKVLEDSNFSQEATFIKGPSGQSSLSGNFVRTIQSEYSASRQRTLERAHDDMIYLSRNLGVEDTTLSDRALVFYKIALERNFTKGRRSEQVQAACLYIAFRENNKPYLLIDFSNYLRTNVYVLGAVFLQLCIVLSLQEHPIVQKPVDPSLFIIKYTNNLLILKQRSKVIDNAIKKRVSDTALSIVASMKRDWMQTGRKPSGLCGAALYIAALAHGFKYSKSDILRIVHVCEATLTKRLVEFENTTSASLTVEELNMMAKERGKFPIEKPNSESDEHVSKGLLCEHKDQGYPHFALGLCEACYKEFVELSGGLDGGLDPPAFQRAERDRMTKSLCEESDNQSSGLEKTSNGACAGRKEELHAPGPECVGDDVEKMATEDGGNDESCREDMSESLSDIDDLEVEGYLHNEEEKHYKTLIWTEMNREYLEEQAAKEAAAAAAKEAFEANFQNCSEDMLAAKELAESAAAAVAKSRKEKKQRRAQEAWNSGPAQSAPEAFREMLKTKRLSAKINVDRLDNLFDDITQEAPRNKKVRFHLDSDKEGKPEPELEDRVKGDDVMRSVDEFEYEDNMGVDEINLYDENDEFGDYSD